MESYETNQTAQARQRSRPVFVGRRFRIGYYSWQDGLDCIWLVNEEGKYEQTIDHEFLLKNFEIESIAKERSLYGRGRPQLGPMMRGPYGEQLEEA